MKGLVCYIEKDVYNDKRIFICKEKSFVLCISEVHQEGVCILYQDGCIETVNPESLRVNKPSKIPAFLDDWRVQIGFESWNQYD